MFESKNNDEWTISLLFRSLKENLIKIKKQKILSRFWFWDAFTHHYFLSNRRPNNYQKDIVDGFIRWIYKKKHCGFKISCVSFVCFLIGLLFNLYRCYLEVLLFWLFGFLSFCLFVVLFVTLTFCLIFCVFCLTVCLYVV